MHNYSNGNVGQDFNVNQDPNSVINSPDQLWTFSSFLLSRLSSNVLQTNFRHRFNEVMEKTVRVTSDFSGMGAEIMSGINVLGALHREGKQFTSSVEPPLKFIRAADIEPTCRSFLDKYGSHGPSCIFGDYMEKVTQTSRIQAADLHAVAMDDYKALLRDAVPPAEARKKAGHKFMQAMLDMVFSPSFKLRSRVHCYKHQCRCLAWDEDGKNYELGLRGNFAGVICQQWSTRGSRNEFLDLNTAELLAYYLRERYDSDDDYAIVECTRLFDSDVFSMHSKIIDKFETTIFFLCPSDLGLPQTRQRKFMVLLNNRRLRWHDGVSHDPQGTLLALFGRQIGALPRNMYMRTPEHILSIYRRQAAIREGLPETKRSGKEWSSFQCLPYGYRQRLLNHEAHLESVQLRVRDAWCLDLQQTPQFQAASWKLPAIIRNSYLWSTFKRRTLELGELAESMGFGPVFTEQDFSEQDPARGPALHSIDANPRPAVLELFKPSMPGSTPADIDRSDLKHMLGNGVCVPVLTALHVFVWSCTVPVEVPEGVAFV